MDEEKKPLIPIQLCFLEIHSPHPSRLRRATFSAGEGYFAVDEEKKPPSGREVAFPQEMTEGVRVQ